MALRDYYPVAFMRGDDVVFQVKGWIDTPRGEPFDTVHVYDTAFCKLNMSIKRGLVPSDFFEIVDRTVMERPLGVFTSFTGDEMEQLFDQVCELEKFKPDRDSCLRITRLGLRTCKHAFKDLELPLRDLSETDYARVLVIVDELQTPGVSLEYRQRYDKVGFCVQAGAADTHAKEMKFIFKGGPYSCTPLVVDELTDMAKLRPGVPLQGKQAGVLGMTWKLG